MMSPEALLDHHDGGRLWPADLAPFTEPAEAYRRALAVRALRIARGECPRGYKIGFTNRTIWALYGVWAPIWGTVWDTTLVECDGDGVLDLSHLCQPRLEPEAVFGFRAPPPADADLDALFDALAWIAPGFEVVQSHRPGWKFTAADTMADSGLHGRLLVGRKTPLAEVARDATALHDALAAATVRLCRGDEIVDRGCGANVLDCPLHALLHFVRELRACPGAPDIRAGDVLTTGTWTDAWAVEPGQQWRAAFDAPLTPLAVRFA